MRYLKTFNENLNQSDLDEIIQNCKDILLDLKDDSEGYGYVVLEDIFRASRGNYNRIFISIQNDNQFEISDIKNVLDRLNSYMSSIGWTEIICQLGYREDPYLLETFFYYCELEFEKED